MEQKLVQSGNALDEKAKEQAKEYRVQQLKKLKKMKQKEKALQKELEKQEEEMLQMEDEFNTQKKKLTDNQKAFQKIKKMYKGALEEINDLEHEH